MNDALKERERCARIADKYAASCDGPLSSMNESIWGAGTAKQIAAEIRSGRAVPGANALFHWITVICLVASLFLILFFNIR